MENNEIYHGIVGIRLGRLWFGKSLKDDVIGQPSYVEFNWEKVMDREEKRGDIIGFYHTHPHFIGSPSKIDISTMQSWVLSFGRSLICLIEGIDGLNAHWFIDDEQDYITKKVWRIGNVFYGMLP